MKYNVLLYLQVIPVINAASINTPIIGALVSTGSYITSIAADHTSKLWVSTQDSSVFTIAPDSGISYVVNGIKHLAGSAATPFFGGKSHCFVASCFIVHVLSEYAHFFVNWQTCQTAPTDNS